MTLGDLKPSQLLRKMKSLLPGGTGEVWYRQAFLSKLPAQVRLQLATNREALATLAEAADFIVDTLRNEPQGVLVNTVTPVQDGEEALQAEIAAVYNKYGRHPPNPQQGMPNKGGQVNQNKSNGICFFHFRFGDKAKKCVPPCNYKPRAGNASGL
jgi:hypothetical protein